MTASTASRRSADRKRPASTADRRRSCSALQRPVARQRCAGGVLAVRRPLVFYHTRILKDALRTIGLRMEVTPPGFTARSMVRGMVHLPDAFANVIVLCGEVFGVAIFSLLLQKARTLFAHQPQALARIEELFSQILVDEVFACLVE